MKLIKVSKGFCRQMRFALLTSVFTSSALAQQEQTEAVVGASNRTIYDADFFDQYSVITARDQLDLIPGIQGVIGGGGGGGGDGGGQRGFGNSGDQVLINGERISGKANDINSVLERVQARQVIRIEVIHGAEAGLDVRSQGPIVNLVLDDALSTGYGSWQAEWRHSSNGVQQYGYGLSYAGTAGDLDYLVSAESSPRSQGQERDEYFFDELENPLERQAESTFRETGESSLIANTGYGFENGDSLNLNGLYERGDEIDDEFSRRFRFDEVMEYFLRDVAIVSESDSTSWELGGDYSHRQENGNQVKVLFVINESSNESARISADLQLDAPTEIDDVQEENRNDSEKILRGTYNWGITDKSSYESGLELALNSLERSIRLFENEDGILQEVVLFNQGSTVEEKRIEGFTTYSTQLTDGLFMEASLDLEFSEIGQEGGDVNRSRDFFFAKPRVALRYDLSDSSQLRARIERTVSQLDFGEFVSSFSNDDNRSGVISAGNPGLEPEQAWEYELGYEYRFADDMGLISVTGLYRDVQDHLAAIPLLVTEADGSTTIRTAPGNIGDGVEKRLTLDGSFRLGWINLDSILVEGSITASDSRVTDPFTNEDIKFNRQSDYRWNIGFRHDTGWKGLSYGVTAQRTGPRYNTDLDYVQEMTENMDLELFAELQPVSGVSLRLDVRDTLRAERQRERLQFEGIRAGGILERHEERFFRPFRIVTLSLRGTF